ncbi:MAG: HAMP domain-containing protein [Deltaproteobacteria bacterium]|nr:HAMP domain-containing protein [Deltaproteobacteria bacterium]
MAPAPDSETRESASAASPGATPRPALAVDALGLWQRFHVRLTGLYGGAVFAVITLMGVIFYTYGVEVEVAALQSRMRAMAVSIAAGVTVESVQPLRQAQDRERAEYRQLVQRFASICRDEPDVTSIYVLLPTEQTGVFRFAADHVTAGGVAPAMVGELYDARRTPAMQQALQTPTAENETYTDKWGEFMSGYAPVRDASGRGMAVLGVDVRAERVAAMKANVRALTLAIYAFAVLLLLPMAWLVARHVRRPLSAIIATTGAIARGQLDAQTNLHRNDEFGLLAKHLDKMALGLRERETIRATFGRYVSEEVARKVLSSNDAAALGGEERQVTVLLTDLANYSTLAEFLPPVAVVQTLNAYMTAMGELIDQHGGCVIEYQGDAILCVFGAPGELPGHAQAAVECASAMVQRLHGLNAEWQASGVANLWQARGIAQIGARVGIHTGRVVAGNVGSASRVKYAVVGDAVNVAARVEALNKETGTELLFTEATWRGLAPELQAQAEFRGEHAVKGRAQVVRVWTLRAKPPDDPSPAPAEIAGR